MLDVNIIMKLDWYKLDNLIIEYLPNMTCVEFCNKYAQETIPRTIGKRAKELKISPKKYYPTEEHKKATANGTKKKFDQDVCNYIKEWLNKKSRMDIAKDLGISLHLVKRISHDLGLKVDDNMTKQFQAAASCKHIKKALQASIVRLSDPEFRNKKSQLASISSKLLWQNEEYRLKVRNGLRRSYDTTDLRERLSRIGKHRYETDQSVRDILHTERQFKNSKLNDMVAAKLDSFGIKFEREYEIANFRFDFKINNILLEVNGDFWHSLDENKANDQRKATHAERYFPEYNLRVMWESELHSVRGNDRLLELLDMKKIEPQLVNLKDLEFVINPQLDINKFLVSFHYLSSSGRKKHIFAMLLHGELIAVAIFGQPIRQNIAPGRAIELTRLCRHPKFYNPNMLSYFLAKCEREICILDKYDYIVSYADKRYHEGTIYKAVNWIDCGDTVSDYCYMSVLRIPMHKKTLYNRAIYEGLTEREYSEKYGYVKNIIGCKRKFMRVLTK